MAGVQWYVTLEGVEQGPLSPAQVKDLVAAGAIGVTTPIRREGMDRAVPAAAVKGLLPESTVAEARQAGPAAQAPAAGESPTAAAPPPDAATLGDTRRMPQAADPANRTTRRAPTSDFDPGDEAAEELDGVDPVELRASIGQRMGASLLDRVIVGVVAILMVVVGIAISGAIVSGAYDRIDQQRREMSAERSEGEGMPSFDDWASGLRDEVPDEIPPAPERGEDEDEETWQARQREHNEVLATIKYEQKLYDWREKQYQRDLPAVDRAERKALVVTGLFAALAGLLVLAYHPLLEGIRGRTIGQQLLGLWVVDAQRRPIRLGKGLARLLCRFIPFYFVTVFGAQRQALHDSLTGSQVVGAEAVRHVRGKGRSARAASRGTGRVAARGTERVTSRTTRRGRRR